MKYDITFSYKEDGIELSGVGTLEAKNIEEAVKRFNSASNYSSFNITKVTQSDEGFW